MTRLCIQFHYHKKIIIEKAAVLFLAVLTANFQDARKRLSIIEASFSFFSLFGLLTSKVPSRTTGCIIKCSREQQICCQFCKNILC